MLIVHGHIGLGLFDFTGCLFRFGFLILVLVLVADAKSRGIFKDR